MKYVTSLLLILTATLLQAQINQTLTQRVFDIWTVNDGLPQNMVESLAQTRDGFIWTGSQLGLVRFDGVRFDLFNRENTAVIQDDYIARVIATKDGRLWFSCGSGYLYYRDVKGEFHKVDDFQLPQDNASVFKEDSKGRLLIGTAENGLFVCEDGKVKNLFKLPDQTVIWCMEEDLNGHIWLGTNIGLYQLKDGEEVRVFTKKDGLPNKGVWSLYQGKDGTFWVGTRSGLCTLKDGTVTVYPHQDQLPQKSINALFEDSDGNLWVGTYSGGMAIISRDRKSISQFTEKEGLPYNNIMVFLEDREGTIWVGQESGGLLRFGSGSVTTWSTQEGMPHDMVRSLLADEDDSLWIATDGGGLTHFRDGKFQHYTKENGLSSNYIMCLFKDRKNILWIGTYGGGLLRFSNGEFQVYGENEGLFCNMIRAMAQTEDGDLWMATDRGLIRKSGDHFRVYTEKDGLNSGLVINVLADRKNTLWISTRGGGLNYYRDGVFSAITTKEGLSSNQVLSLYEDDDDRLWVGTSDGGLNLLHQDKIRRYSLDDGLFDDMILEILDDKNGNLWFSSNHGIFTVPIKDLLNYDGTEKLHSEVFDTEDGMKSSECNGGTYPAGVRTRDGRLWFPTIQGIASIHPQFIQTNKKPPPIHITKVLVNGELKTRNQIIKLFSVTDRLEIHYTGLSLIEPERVQFTYMMEGVDEREIEAGTRRVAYYTGLPPGDFQFKVIGANNDGVVNRDGATLNVRVVAHFYQQLWFKLIILLAVILLAFLIHLLRLYRINKQHLELERLVEERTNVLRGTHQRLVEAQERVIEAAHRAGMAEIACNVLQQVEDAVDRVSLEVDVSHKLVEGFNGPDMISDAVGKIRELGEETAKTLDEDPNGIVLKEKLVTAVVDMGEQRTELADQLDYIRNQINQLTQIVSAQQKYAKQDDHSQPVDINLLLADAIKIKAKDLRLLKIEVHQDLQVLPTYKVQRSKLLRVFLNLFQNACESMADNNPETKRILDIATHKNNTAVVIEIQDSGVGISSEVLPRVFAQGFAMKGDGAHFLLHDCANAVREMNGDIQAFSKGRGKGSSFRVSLPLTHTVVDDEDWDET